MISVDDAIAYRRSVRAFLPDPVSRETVEHILAIASRAPSGTNTQPWKVYVLTGAAKERLTAAILEEFYADPAANSHERLYYMEKWREPYVSRRRKVGWDMYGLVGVTREDKEGMREQTARNYKFFDAPVGMIFTIDQDMHWGSWLDYGMFLENVMLAARGQGLETCPQAAFAGYHKVLRRVLGIADSEAVVCGMALGKEDTSAVINTLQTVREPVSEFSDFRDA
jgi:nitroreductase